MTLRLEDLPSAVSEILQKVNGIELRLRMASEVSGKLENGLLTISGACVLLNLSKNTIYKLAQHRAIPYIKKGGRLYFMKDELLAWVKEGSKATIAEIATTTESDFIQANKRRIRK